MRRRLMVWTILAAFVATTSLPALLDSSERIHAIWSLQMSTTTIAPFVRPGPSGCGLAEPSTSFLVKWLVVLLDWSERRQQSKALAELAEDARLLADIGLTREQALGQPTCRSG